MIFKYGDFRENESRSDIDRTKIAEVWVKNCAISKQELASADQATLEQLEFDFIKNNK